MRCFITFNLFGMWLKKKKKLAPYRSVHISQRELEFTNTGNSSGSARRERALGTNPEVLRESAHSRCVQF